ncbi:MAG: hypothetical protein WCK58_00520, partial [Chloroflexota bacterium]
MGTTGEVIRRQLEIRPDRLEPVPGAPTMKAVVKDVVNGLSNAAGAMTTAMDSMQDMSAAMTGDPEVLKARAAALQAAGAKLPPANTPEFRAALVDFANGQIARAAALPSGKSREEILKVCNAVKLAKAKRTEWKPGGQVRDEEAIAKVCRGVQGILHAAGTATVAVVTPALNMLASLVNVKLAVEINAVLRQGATMILGLIPEAGGIIGGIFNVVSGVVVRGLLDTVSGLLIKLGTQQLRFEIEDFDVF